MKVINITALATPRVYEYVGPRINGRPTVYHGLAHLVVLAVDGATPVVLPVDDEGALVRAFTCFVERDIDCSDYEACEGHPVNG